MVYRDSIISYCAILYNKYNARSYDNVSNVWYNVLHIMYSVLYAALLSRDFNIVYILVRAVSLDRHKWLPWATVEPQHLQHLVAFRSRFSKSQCWRGRVDVSEVESRTKSDWYEVRKRKGHRYKQTHIDKPISFLTESGWEAKVEERGNISKVGSPRR